MNAHRPVFECICAVAVCGTKGNDATVRAEVFIRIELERFFAPVTPLSLLDAEFFSVFVPSRPRFQDLAGVCRFGFTALK